MTHTVLVTGGNKGIGLEVCRQLGARGARVFLAARDKAAGLTAAQSLKSEGHNVEFLLMDIASETSINDAAKALATRTDALHAIVNNAGIFLEREAQGLDFDPANIMATFQTNTLGPLLTTRAMLPLLAKGANVVNVSSGMGQLDDMREGSIGYRLSKVALNAVTRILSAELSDRNIRVNSVCPGWVKTDMGGKGAHRTTAQGADTIVWLAMGENGATGKFYRDHAELPW